MQKKQRTSLHVSPGRRTRVQQIRHWEQFHGEENWMSEIPQSSLARLLTTPKQPPRFRLQFAEQ